jgi:hypothetical protein
MSFTNLGEQSIRDRHKGLHGLALLDGVVPDFWDGIPLVSFDLRTDTNMRE